MKAILYDWGGANVWLFHRINDVHGSLLDAVMRFATELGGHLNFGFFMALACLAALSSVSRKSGHGPATIEREALRWLMVLCVFSIGYVADGLLIGWLKSWLDFPRPLLALPPGTVHVVGRPEYYHSLPSGHASFSMLLVASLWPVMNRGWRGAGVIFVLLVGLSRISVGAHFPADVVYGYAKTLLLVLALRGGLAVLLRAVRGAGASADS